MWELQMQSKKNDYSNANRFVITQKENHNSYMQVSSILMFFRAVFASFGF